MDQQLNIGQFYKDLEMEKPVSNIEALFEAVESYATATYQLTKLHIQANVSLIVAKGITQLSLFCTILFSIMAFNIGIALWLGDLLGKIYYGFFILMGFYLLIALFLHFWLKDYLKNVIRNRMNNLYLKK